MESVKERFDRIESTLEKGAVRLNGITARLEPITEAHVELEVAQKNTLVC